MTKPSLIVPLADLEHGPRSVEFSLDPGWLAQALDGTDATLRGPAGRATLELSKNGREVLVRGKIEVDLSMPCVVTLDPVDVDVRAALLLLLSPAAASASAPSTSSGPGAHRGKGKLSPLARDAAATGRPRARARAREESELSDEDAAHDTFEGSQIVLDSFVREFILLELPMFPRRSDLPSEDGPAIPPPPEADRQDHPVDPRLQPLAALRSRLHPNKE